MRFEVESVIHDLKPGDKVLKADVKATRIHPERPFPEAR